MKAAMQALGCMPCHTCPVSQALISLAVLGKAKVNGLQRRIFVRCQVQEIVWLDISDQHIARMTLGDCSQDITHSICCICKNKETCQVTHTLLSKLCMGQPSWLNLSASCVLTRSDFCMQCKQSSNAMHRSFCVHQAHALTEKGLVTDCTGTWHEAPFSLYLPLRTLFHISPPLHSSITSITFLLSSYAPYRYATFRDRPVPTSIFCLRSMWHCTASVVQQQKGPSSAAHQHAMVFPHALSVLQCIAAMLGAESTAQRTMQQLLSIHGKQGSVLTCISWEKLLALVFCCVLTTHCGQMV